MHEGEHVTEMAIAAIDAFRCKYACQVGSIEVSPRDWVLLLDYSKALANPLEWLGRVKPDPGMADGNVIVNCARAEAQGVVVTDCCVVPAWTVGPAAS